MYDYLKGKVAKVQHNLLVLDVAGVGYKIFITTSTATQLNKNGETITLFTSFIVKEDGHALYGFIRENERDLFEILLNINGIGPRTALSIITHLTIEELANTLIRKDVNTLCKVPGIGKKTAERLLIELKDRLPSLASLSSPTALIPHLTRDSISALMNLGYNLSTAQNAVKKALEKEPQISDLSTLITASLKHIN